MRNEESNGKAYVAGWIIKMLAVAALGWATAFATSVATTQSTHNTRLTKVETTQIGMEKQLDRIESKLDKVLTRQEGR